MPRSTGGYICLLPRLLSCTHTCLPVAVSIQPGPTLGSLRFSLISWEDTGQIGTGSNGAIRSLSYHILRHQGLGLAGIHSEGTQLGPWQHLKEKGHIPARTTSLHGLPAPEYTACLYKAPNSVLREQ